LRRELLGEGPRASNHHFTVDLQGDSEAA
jgi:hypothetical protein